jgi:hypothetical protein
VIGNTLDNFLHDEDNFLTQEEVNLINTKVKSLRGYWKNFLEYNIAEEEYFKKIQNNSYKNVDYNILRSYYSIQNNLGDAVYMLEPGKFDEINYELQSILRNEFEWLYARLLDTTKKVYNFEDIKYSDDLPLPGFHIHFGEFDMTNFTTHKDTSILHFKENVDINSISSYTSIIESPKSIAHMDYGFGKKVYESGKLHFWNGMVDHKIGDFGMSLGEYRITFQGHSYKDSKDGTVYLYF